EAAIPGSKNARCSTACGEPREVIAEDGNTGAAGGKRGLTRNGSRLVLARDFFPYHAVFGSHDRKASIDRIAECDAVSCIPKRKSIEKRLGHAIHELESPALAAIRSFVNAGLFTFSRAEDVCRIRVNRVDISE